MASEAIVVVHNHPTGDSTPSNEDIVITKRLKQAGEIINIKLIDHVIVTETDYVSLKGRGIL